MPLGDREAAELAAFYDKMPRLGLALAGDHLALAVKSRCAARRIGARAQDVPADPHPGA
jgi:hypothetical protein